MEALYVKLPGVWPSCIISSKTFIPLVGFLTPHQRKNNTLIVISISIRLNLVLHRLKQCIGILDQITLAWSIQQVKGIHFGLHLTLILFFLANFWTRSDTSRYNSSKWLRKLSRNHILVIPLQVIKHAQTIRNSCFLYFVLVKISIISLKA
jgi:hypothetical protein